MKKKTIATVLTIVMAMSMVACGSKEDTTTNVQTEKVEAVTESVEEEKTEVSEDVTEVGEQSFTIEDGMTKVNRLMEAHQTLLRQDKELENAVQADTENLTGDHVISLISYTTADSKTIQTKSCIYATAIVYYNEYVNNNGEYYDFAEWLSSQANDMAIRSNVKGLDKDSIDNTNNVLLLEAIGVVAYLENCTSVTGTDVIESTDYTISGVQSAYIIPLDCDGDTSLTAVFDSDGNLLNICSADDWNNYMSSF